MGTDYIPSNGILLLFGYIRYWFFYFYFRERTVGNLFLLVMEMMFIVATILSKKQYLDIPRPLE